MNEYEYKPRFSFEVSQELKERSDEILSTYGIRRALFSIVLEDLLDLIEEHGQMVIGAILDNAVKPREILPKIVKAERRVK